MCELGFGVGAYMRLVLGAPHIVLGLKPLKW